MDHELTLAAARKAVAKIIIYKSCGELPLLEAYVVSISGIFYPFPYFVVVLITKIGHSNLRSCFIKKFPHKTYINLL